MIRSLEVLVFFFFNDTATTEIYTLSLHDALPISHRQGLQGLAGPWEAHGWPLRHRTGHGAPLVSAAGPRRQGPDRKSTRLNSSHLVISYAVFCLKKKQ